MSGVVIVGAGHAGGMLAAALRQGGYEGQVTLVGDEAFPPYQRPPLSKEYLSGTQPLERVLLRPEKFYADKDIDLRKNASVTAIDRAAKTVVVSQDGKSETLAYDHLALATGSRPRELPIPGADLKNVFYLRTIADVDAIREAFAPERSLVIIGGGYIGLEVAAVARETGLAVTVLEMESRILQRVATEDMSAFYDEVHRAAGVDLQCDARADSIIGAADGAAAQVKTADGNTIAADLVLIGIGVVPNIELAEAAGLTCDNGIAVDQYCRTNDPAIFALGDCCNAMNLALGRSARLESVPNAMEQSRVVADAINGKDRQYDAVPWFWSDQYDLKLQMVGFAAEGEQSVTRGNPAERQFITFYLRDGRVVAGDAVNSAKEFMACRKLVESGKEVDADALADTAVELKTLL